MEGAMCAYPILDTLRSSFDQKYIIENEGNCNQNSLMAKQSFNLQQDFLFVIFVALKVNSCFPHFA